MIGGSCDGSGYVEGHSPIFDDLNITGDASIIEVMSLETILMTVRGKIYGIELRDLGDYSTKASLSEQEDWIDSSSNHVASQLAESTSFDR